MSLVNEKFIFSLEYELDLLKFTLTDRDGVRALKLYTPDYFQSLDYAIITNAVKNYHKRKKKLPGPTMLKEELLDLFKTRDYVNSLTPDDKTRILEIAPTLYHPVRDGEEILTKCAQWASYVELKDNIESVDLLDFSKYTAFSNKVLKSINIANPKHKNAGTLLIKDIKERQFNRQDLSPVVPTPFKQINALTNAGGYVRGSIIVILDKPKAAKTTALVNVAEGYLKMRKKVFLADLENGEDELSLRFEQGISRKSKMDVLSGEFDDKVQKILRKYARLGGEVFIKRYPAHSTIYDFQEDMDRLYRDEGIRFDVALVDYAGLMGSTTKKEDDTARISDVYLDLANFALKNNLEHIWTPHHIIRAAKVREKTKYSENDIAKCIDIIRHVQAIFGLNRNEYELENNIMRMELVAQRDGQPWGRALFHMDQKIQKIKEFSPKEVENYSRQMQDAIEELDQEIKGDI